MRIKMKSNLYKWAAVLKWCFKNLFFSPFFKLLSSVIFVPLFSFWQENEILYLPFSSEALQISVSVVNRVELTTRVKWIRPWFSLWCFLSVCLCIAVSASTYLPCHIKNIYRVTKPPEFWLKCLFPETPKMQMHEHEKMYQLGVAL